jgi:hypothetical protein
VKTQLLLSINLTINSGAFVKPDGTVKLTLGGTTLVIVVAVTQDN